MTGQSGTTNPAPQEPRPERLRIRVFTFDLADLQSVGYLLGYATAHDISVRIDDDRDDKPVLVVVDAAGTEHHVNQGQQFAIDPITRGVRVRRD